MQCLQYDNHKATVATHEDDLLSLVQGHDDDIKCMAIHPDRNIVATGQVASALDGTADAPYVLVWDVRDLLGVITRINFPDDGGQPSR
jgi:WD40 repeat protein